MDARRRGAGREPVKQQSSGEDWMGQISRREFVGRSALGAAGLLTGGYLATSRGYAANETLNIGCIGTGGRCRQLMEQARQLPGVRLAAVCDVWQDNIGRGKEITGQDVFSSQYYED